MYIWFIYGGVIHSKFSESVLRRHYHHERGDERKMNDENMTVAKWLTLYTV